MSITISIREKNDTEKRIWELNRRASELKDSDLHTAIAFLAEAQRLRPTVPTQYTVAEYLRLPVFLQQDGRMEEAKQEFQKILGLFKDGYDRAKIYDKMRLCYEREKRFDEAVVYGVVSLASEILGMQDRVKREEANLQRLISEQKKMTGDRRERYQGFIDSSRERIHRQQQENRQALEQYLADLPEHIKKLLKKAKKETALVEILNNFSAFTQECSLKACNVLGQKMAHTIKNFKS